MTFHDISICIPAFNEADAIGETVKQLQEMVPEAEILVVNDGSTDQTAAILHPIQNITLIEHSHNIGYGGALKTAIRRASREVVVWYDADGQHTPDDLRRVVSPVLSGEKDAVIGTRDTYSDVRPSRAPGKLVLKWVAELMIQKSIPDINSGLRCFKKDVIKRYLHLLPDGFSASTTSTLLMMKRGYRLGYVPITTQKRIGTSTVKIVRDGWRTLILILRILVLFDAFNFFTLLAMLQILPGVCYGIYIAFLRKEGFPTLASTIVISGILTFFMGIICDQIVAMRQERLES